MTRKLLNETNFEIKKCLKKDRDKAEREQGEKIMNETNANKKWELLKNFENGEKTTGITSGIKNGHGRLTIDKQEIAEIFAERLETVHSQPTNHNFDDTWKQEVEEVVKNKEN